MNISKLFKILGPGLLYAGAAVGVSHLVQSTRAGASYGFELVWILILVNVIKYPFFEFGPRYAAATGKSLIDGYRKTGNWALIIYAVLTVATMFTIQAAVTIVTAGIVGNIFHIELSPVGISAILLCLTVVILMIGRYAVLDKLIKWVIIILAISTILAVIFALANYNPSAWPATTSFSWVNKLDIFFLIAFIGWMPAPIDVTVWQSLWTNAKYESLKTKPILKDSLLDFRIGYIGTALLAIGFLVLGAIILYGNGEELSPNGVVFAGQLISLYTQSIGPWAYYLIAIAAMATMFSTTLTCLDAYPRVMIPLSKSLFPQFLNKLKHNNKLESWFWIILVAGGALVLMSLLSGGMRAMVDIATTLSFVTAPLLAYLNFRAVTDSHMPLEAKPGLGLKIYAWVGIVLLGAFTLFYLGWRFLL